MMHSMPECESPGSRIGSGSVIHTMIRRVQPLRGSPTLSLELSLPAPKTGPSEPTAANSLDRETC
jgi:hypothetical protein